MRFLACALLVIATAHASQVCEPNSVRYKGDDTCFCLEDGSKELCVNELTPIPELSQNPDKNSRHARSAQVCVPDTITVTENDTCYCLEDGSKEICKKDLKPGEVFPDLEPETVPANYEEDKCEPGKRFKFYCNTCTCSFGGVISESPCTMMYCNPDTWNIDGSRKSLARTLPISKKGCWPNTVRVTEHDTCICLEDGSKEICKKDLKPGEVFPDLEPKTVPANYKEDKCEPGTKFKFYCNTCTCSFGGVISMSPCTMMYCNPATWNIDGSRKSLSRSSPFESESREGKALGLDGLLNVNNYPNNGHIIPPFVPEFEQCVPDTFFSRFCNTCYCPFDGRAINAACSNEECDLAVWNWDGTRKDNKNEVSSRRTRQAERSCSPGSEFKKFCNFCTCGPDGKYENAACTKMACDPDLWNEDGTRKEPQLLNSVEVARSCRPGTEFKKFCNFCRCGKDGDYQNAACTKMACDPDLWNEDGTRKQPLLLNSVQTERACMPGTHFKKFCNVCRCGPDGKYANAVCSRMGCHPDLWNEDGSSKVPSTLDSVQTGRTCTPAFLFKKFCNTCTCGPDGKYENAACTKMACDPAVWNEDGSKKVPLVLDSVRTERSCTPGFLFKKFCNTCTCGPDGKYENAACTKMACDPAVWNEDGTRKDGERCEAGKSYNYYCNTCTCAANGLKASSVCTMAYCIPGFWNEDGTLIDNYGPGPTHMERNLKVTERKFFDGENCVPGTHFNKFCNTCLCSPDGKVANSVCSQEACDLNMWKTEMPIKSVEGEIALKKQERSLEEERCTPGESFKFYCTTCSCGEDGLVENAVCQFIQCDLKEWNQDGTRREELEYPSAITFPEDDEERCTPGESFKFYCNTCSCGEDGLVENAVCPFMRCEEDVWNRDGTRKPFPRVAGFARSEDEVCEPGTNFRDYCNVCTCSPNGRINESVCTLKSCNLEEWYRNGTRKHPEDEVFDGEVETVNEERCEPGKSFKYYCNTCRCAATGLVKDSSCTTMFCRLDFWNKDGSAKKALTLTSTGEFLETNLESKESCPAGRYFYNYCNLCKCAYDGKVSHSSCTMMFCAPGLWNKDGSSRRPSVEMLPHYPVARQLPQVQKTCQPGAFFKNNCNRCRCPADGNAENAVCTYMSCTEEVGGSRIARDVEDRCTPGTSFSYYCNYCKCAADGLVSNSACTMAMCDLNEWNKDGTRRTVQGA